MSSSVSGPNKKTRLLETVALPDSLDDAAAAAATSAAAAAAAGAAGAGAAAAVSVMPLSDLLRPLQLVAPAAAEEAQVQLGGLQLSAPDSARHSSEEGSGPPHAVGSPAALAPHEWRQLTLQVPASASGCEASAEVAADAADAAADAVAGVMPSPSPPPPEATAAAAGTSGGTLGLGGHGGRPALSAGSPSDVLDSSFADTLSGEHDEVMSRLMLDDEPSATSGMAAGQQRGRSRSRLAAGAGGPWWPAAMGPAGGSLLLGPAAFGKQEPGGAQDGVLQPLQPGDVFVGGLPPDVSEEQLRAVLEEAGQVVSVRLQATKRSGAARRCKGYAYATYVDREAAERAVQQQVVALGGQRLGLHLCRRSYSLLPELQPHGPTLHLAPEPGASINALLAAVRSAPDRHAATAAALAAVQRSGKRSLAQAEAPQQQHAQHPRLGDGGPGGGAAAPGAAPEGEGAEEGDGQAPQASAAKRPAPGPAVAVPAAADGAGAGGGAASSPQAAPSAAAGKGAKEEAAAQGPPVADMATYLQTTYPKVQALLQLFKSQAKGAQDKTPLMLLNEYASRMSLEVCFSESCDGLLGPFTLEARLVTGGSERTTHAQGSGRARTKKDAKQVAAAAVLDQMLGRGTEPQDFMPTAKGPPPRETARPGLGYGSGRPPLPQQQMVFQAATSPYEPAGAQYGYQQGGRRGDSARGHGQGPQQAPYRGGPHSAGGGGAPAGSRGPPAGGGLRRDSGPPGPLVGRPGGRGAPLPPSRVRPPPDRYSGGPAGNGGYGAGPAGQQHGQQPPPPPQQYGSFGAGSMLFGGAHDTVGASSLGSAGSGLHHGYGANNSGFGAFHQQQQQQLGPMDLPMASAPAATAGGLYGLGAATLQVGSSNANAYALGHSFGSGADIGQQHFGGSATSGSNYYGQPQQQQLAASQFGGSSFQIMDSQQQHHQHQAYGMTDASLLGQGLGGGSASGGLGLGLGMYQQQQQQPVGAGASGGAGGSPFGPIGTPVQAAQQQQQHNGLAGPVYGYGQQQQPQQQQQLFGGWS